VSDHSFPKSRRLRTRRQFYRVSRAGKRLAGDWLVVCFCSNNQEDPRLGLTVSTRFGKSHERNRFKRLVRETFRKVWQDLPSGMDINIKPRSKAVHATATDIEEELLRLVAVV